MHQFISFQIPIIQLEATILIPSLSFIRKVKQSGLCKIGDANISVKWFHTQNFQILIRNLIWLLISKLAFGMQSSDSNLRLLNLARLFPWKHIGLRPIKTAVHRQFWMFKVWTTAQLGNLNLRFSSEIASRSLLQVLPTIWLTSIKGSQVPPTDLIKSWILVQVHF